MREIKHSVFGEDSEQLENKRRAFLKNTQMVTVYEDKKATLDLASQESKDRI